MALAEVLRVQLDVLYDLAGFKLDISQRGAYLHPCPLVEKAVKKLEALRIGLRVMRKAADDRISVRGGF